MVTSTSPGAAVGGAYSRIAGADETAEIAVEAYLYAFPLVLMDATRQAAEELGVRSNQFSHAGAFPDASLTDTVRPNSDTLYSSLWYDVRAEPLVIRAPDTGGRYFLLPTLDLWSDVFASPGSRTTGSQAQAFAIAAAAWSGALPAGINLIHAPTPMGWVLGRTQANGAADLPRVREIQAALTATPLSRMGAPAVTGAYGVGALVAGAPSPLARVLAMGAVDFFSRCLQLMEVNPPHANDQPVLARMSRIGLQPGRPLDLSQLEPRACAAIEAAPGSARMALGSSVSSTGLALDGWRMPMSPIGTYGTDYFRRAVVAYSGLGANTLEDALYPTAFADSDGRGLDSAARYVVHFEPDQMPPARAFWSLSIYNDEQLFAANPINRYAIGNRDDLRFKPDGSLDILVQRAWPGTDYESNWLPAPAAGGMSMDLRLYWPRPEALSGEWRPPEVRRLRD